MKYDFDAVINRRNTDSVKWDLMSEGELPMWVADMDFTTAPAITEAIAKRAAHGVFGYTLVPDEWYTSIINWWGKRHGLTLTRDDLCFCTGVIPAITSSVKRMTNVGDNVVVLTPVYNVFFNSIENSGRHVLECRLKYDGAGYDIDFEDLEECLAHPLTTLMILCNPHNPVGRIWSREELCRIGEMCRRHGVFVISDEIHCDLTDPDFEYTPFAASSRENAEIVVSCISTSKAFNIAGLQSAAVIAQNPHLRERIVRGLNSDEVAEPNCFAALAAAVAFGECGEWLDELRAYLSENKRRVREFVSNELPVLSMFEQRATYLLWIDCSRITADSILLADFIRERTGLVLTAGRQYRGDSAQFMRMNVACPRIVLEDGLGRLKRGISEFCAEKGIKEYAR